MHNLKIYDTKLSEFWTYFINFFKKFTFKGKKMVHILMATCNSYQQWKLLFKGCKMVPHPGTNQAQCRLHGCKANERASGKKEKNEAEVRREKESFSSSV